MQSMMDEVSARAAGTLRGIVNGLRASQALLVVARLNVADHLAQGPLDGHELARVTGTNPAALGRVMRALCALGVFTESISGQFSLNPAAQLLRRDVPGSFRAGVLFLGGDVRWRCWSDLMETVRTGMSAGERMLGMELFDFYAVHSEESKLHDDAMRAFSATQAVALLNAIDFPDAGVVVDVGGGTGELLAAILAAWDPVGGPRLFGQAFKRNRSPSEASSAIASSLRRPAQ